jgi:hypothetical protein
MSEHLYTTNNADIERLISLGFSAVEASRLVYMKSHVTDEVEYRETLEENRRLNFIRWLVEHNRLSN